MKNHFHKIATYTALILVSSLPFSIDVLAETEKKQSPVTSLSSADKNLSAIKRKMLAEKSQQIVLEAKDSVTGTQQALID